MNDALWFWDDPILAGPWKTPSSWAIFADELDTVVDPEATKALYRLATQRRALGKKLLKAARKAGIKVVEIKLKRRVPEDFMGIPFK
jgi:hypothetical protein